MISKNQRLKANTVEIVERVARLEITFKMRRNGEEESDSNSFSEMVAGREGLSRSEARLRCVEYAQAWIDGLRADGWDVGAWDKDGNCY